MFPSLYHALSCLIMAISSMIGVIGVNGAPGMYSQQFIGQVKRRIFVCP